MTPTEWAIKGELFLNCSCTVFCPCVVSLGAHPPTEGHCYAWMAIAIDEGHYEGEDLSGLNVGLMVEIPGRMAEGGWKVAAYVDDRASGKAYNGILQIFSGAAGGTTGLFTMLVSDIVGAERAKVEIVREGKKRGLYIGRKIQGEIEMIGVQDASHQEATLASGARRVEIFLDYLLAQVHDPNHLLDARFGHLLAEPDQELRRRLLRRVQHMPDEVLRTPAWSKVAEMLRSLGWDGRIPRH